MYNTSAKPLHLQENGLSKAVKKETDSLSKFQADIQHKANAGTKTMDSRATMSGINNCIRRYTSGVLDVEYSLSQIMSAVKDLEEGLPISEAAKALVQTIMPDKVKFMDDSLAVIKTQLSESEKNTLKVLFSAKMKASLLSALTRS